MDLLTARAGARAERPEARVIDTTSGRFVCYVGTTDALTNLECCPGNRYVEARKLRLSEPTPGVATWLVLPATPVTFRMLETVGKLDRVNDGYLAARKETIPVNMEFAEFYPEPPEGLPSPFPHQVECFSESVAALQRGEKGYGCWMDMGLGKGHPVGTRILTPNGWKFIEDLKIGDPVIGSSGKTIQITGVYHRGSLPVYDVSFNDRASIRVDGEHLWLVNSANRRHRNQPGEVLSTQEIAKHLKQNLSIPLVGPIEFANQQTLEIDPYLLGVLLGDGSLQDGTPSFTPGDDRIAEEVRKVLPTGVDLTRIESEGKATAWLVSTGKRGGKSNPVLDALRNLNLGCVKAPEKFVPEKYLLGSVTTRLELLNGLMDTDGEQRPDGHLEFASSSLQLANNVVFLIESLGGQARLRTKKNVTYAYKGKKLKGLPSHQVTIKLPSNVNPFRAFASEFQPWTKYGPCRIIRSVTPVGNADVICLSVDAPDQLYVTERCIVTHNTKLAADLLHALQPTVSLVLIQKITQQQWVDCLQGAFPEATLVILDGAIRARSTTIRLLVTNLKAGDQKAPVVLLLNWDVLYRLQNDLAKLGEHLEVIVGDEITRIKNRNSQVSKSARKLARQAKFRIPMTGTPMTTDPGDLWALFDFQDETAFGMSYWTFMKRYCDLGGPFSEWEFNGLKRERLPELIETVYARAYRQTKAAVTDVPEKLYSKVELELKGEQREHYKRVADKYCTQITLEDGRVGELTVSSAIAKVTRLQQIAAGTVPLTSLTVGEGEEAEVYGGGHKEIVSAKTAWVVEYCQEQNETTDCQGVVWTKFQAEADRVRADLIAAGVEAEIIDGRTKQEDRKKFLTRFSDRETSLRWLVINIAAGAYGLDLPSADVMIYHSSTYNIEERLQSENRGHRAGRIRPYQVVDILLRGTIDVELFRAYKERQDLIRMLVSKGTPR